MACGGGVESNAGQATLLAGLTLVASAFSLAAKTPDDGPWIGSWLDGVFATQRWLGWTLIGLGIVWFGVSRLVGEDLARHDGAIRTDVSAQERSRAIAQRMFNPPHPPKPDWGETLRGVGLFAALVAAGWYLAGAPAVDGYQLSWLREGFEAYGADILIVAATILVWTLLAAAYSAPHPWGGVLFDVPLRAAWWLLSQCGLVLGAAALAIVTGLGVGVFGA